MFFKKKKDPLKTYLASNLESGLKKMVNDGLIDIKSPLAGMHVANYIAHMKDSYMKSATMLSIHHSIPYPNVVEKIDEATQEFKTKWLK